MVKIYDEETGTELGTITEAQLQFLVDQLEEEYPEDVDYHILLDTLDLLEEKGADAGLLTFLRSALGDREEMDIRWARD
jgi:processive 1,2-diacylglycerol beta-glucosyltransferase